MHSYERLLVRLCKPSAVDSRFFVQGKTTYGFDREL